MKLIVRMSMFILAIVIFALALLVFWFVFANFSYRYGFSGTISYMLRTMDSWRQTVALFFSGLF